MFVRNEMLLTVFEAIRQQCIGLLLEPFRIAKCEAKIADF